MAKVLISYRRADAGGWAKSLYSVLRAYFGSANVFYDRRTLQAGDEWFAVIADSIREADAVLVVIGPDWAGPSGGDRTRLDDPDDVVRREIELALAADRWIIPVQVA